MPAGSVAIAAGQTGVYPAELSRRLEPAGPDAPVDRRRRRRPVPDPRGDRLKFEPIDAAEFVDRRGEPLR